MNMVMLVAAVRTMMMRRMRSRRMERGRRGLSIIALDVSVVVLVLIVGECCGGDALGITFIIIIIYLLYFSQMYHYTTDHSTVCL